MHTETRQRDHVDAMFTAISELRFLRERARRQAKSLTLYEQRLRAEGSVVAYSVGIAKLEAIVRTHLP